MLNYNLLLKACNAKPKPSDNLSQNVSYGKVGVGAGVATAGTKSCTAPAIHMGFRKKCVGLHQRDDLVRFLAGE